jgi:RNA polymerase sigma-70 factor (ECF subfamily)
MSEFDKIYSDYFHIVFKYIYSLCRDANVAEEITQETFFKAMKSIDSFRGDCKLRVWLCQIAKNTFYTYYDKAKKQQDVSVLIQPENDFEKDYINKETAYEIHKVLHGIEEPYKEVFALRVFGELSFLQIGDLFDKSESWARVTYYRAKLKIKEKML